MSESIGKRVLDNLSGRSGFDNIISNLDDDLVKEIVNEINELADITEIPATDDTFKIIPSEVFDRAHEDILGFNDREYVEINVLVTAIDTNNKHTVGWVSHHNDGSSYGNEYTGDYSEFHGNIRNLFSGVWIEISKFKGYE